MKPFFDLFSGKAYRPEMADPSFPISARVRGDRRVLVAVCGAGQSLLWDVQYNKGEISVSEDPFVSTVSDRATSLVSAYLDARKHGNSKRLAGPAGVVLGVASGFAELHEAYPASVSEAAILKTYHTQKAMLGKSCPVQYDQAMMVLPLPHANFKRTIFFSWEKGALDMRVREVAGGLPLIRMQGVASSLVRYLASVGDALKASSLVLDDGTDHFVLLTDKDGRWLYSAFPNPGTNDVSKKISDAFAELPEGVMPNRSFLVISVGGADAQSDFENVVRKAGYAVTTVPDAHLLFIKALLAD